MRIPALGLKRKQWEPFAFASPSMVLIGFVIIFPLVYSFYLSFQNFDLSVGPEALAKRKSPKDALDNAVKEWDKITERRGPEKQKEQWGEQLAEMKSLCIEYNPDWAATAK